MKFSTSLLFVLAVCLLPACTDGQSTGDVYPARSINLIINSSAGGATDLANRAISEGLKESLGVEVIASNMPGAMGGTGINYVWNQPHDGYRIAGMAEGSLGHSVLGFNEQTTKDWNYFMVGGTPGIISVRADSPYKDFQSLYAAVKENPGSLTIATSVPGCVWNVQWLNAKKTGGFDTRFIPYPGSFPSQTAALSGEVDIVWTGLGEQSEFLKGDRLRALAVFGKEAVMFDGASIPPITDFIPDLEAAMPIEQFVGFALPADTPEPITARLAEAFDLAMKSEAIATFAEAKFTKLTGLSGEAAKDVAIAQEKAIAWTLWEAGLAKRDPSELGIAKP